MKKILAPLFLLFLCLAGTSQVVSLNPSELLRLKQLMASNPGVARLYKDYQDEALHALTAQTNPIDTITTEGRLKGDPRKTATAEALLDMKKIYSLALAYRLGAGKNYLLKAAEFLGAWAKKNKANGDPIDETNLDYAVEGFDLVKDELPADQKALIANWLRAIAEGEINSRKMVPSRTTSKNNWNSHRLKIVGEIGYTIQDPVLQDWAIQNLEKQIEVNLNPDGSSIDFKLRDALHYHDYDLAPLLKLAILIKRASGKDYYSYLSPTQSSIKKSVQWFVPFLTGQKSHPEYVKTTVPFDVARARNNEAGHEIGALYKPENGLPVLSLAQYFEPGYLEIEKKIKNTSSPFPDWQVVLNEIRR